MSKLNRVDIKGIADKKLPLPKKNNNEFKTLNEYITLTKKLVSTHANGLKPGLAKEILQNEDAISNITHSVMMADWSFNGKGKIEGFRKQRAIWAIMGYISRRSRSKVVWSLDSYMSPDNKTSFSEMVVDKDQVPENTVYSEEFKSKMRECLNKLESEKAKEDIRMYFLENMTFKEIAKKRGVTKQAIEQSISKHLKNLKIILKNDQFFRSIINND